MKIALACIFAVLILFTVPVIAVNADQENTIPSWIKQTMDFWVQGISTDREFLIAIEYMLGEGIITVDEPAVDVLTIGFIPVEKADKISTQATAPRVVFRIKLELTKSIAHNIDGQRALLQAVSGLERISILKICYARRAGLVAALLQHQLLFQ